MAKKKTMEDIKEELRKDSEKAIRSCLCKKCGGVPVHSWITAMMASSWGKRCKCPKTLALQEKIYKQKKKEGLVG